VPDVTSIAPADVRLWVSLDVHKFSIVAATLPPTGGRPEVCRIETTAKAIRRFVAPSLVPVRAGDRVKTDRRDAKKLVGLYRAGLLRFVFAPTPELEGLRDLLRCRDDIRCARTAARHRVLKQLLRHGRIFRDGKTAFSQKHRRWINAQRLDDPLAHVALEQVLMHLDGIERQLDTLDAKLDQIATSERWGGQVEIMTRFRGISTLTAVGLISEIGDFARFGPSARAGVLARDHAERVLQRRPAAPRPHHQGRQPPRPPAVGRGRLALPPRPTPPRRGPAARRARLASPGAPAPPLPPPDRARQALDRRQRRDRPRTRRLPVGRDDRPAPDHPRPAPGGRRLTSPHPGGAGRRGASRPEDLDRSMRYRLATLVRGSSRPDTVLRSRPAHLGVTVVVALAPAARPHQPP
jgi:hypothetical protein